MPVPDLESYKVAAGELSSASKFNNLVQAIEDELADIDPDQIGGYPADVTKFLRGDGAWAAVDWTKIADVDLSATGLVASGIPTTYRVLKLVWAARSPNAGTVDRLFARFNGDSGANYDYYEFFGNNGATTSAAQTAQGQAAIGRIAFTSATANRFGYGEIVIPGYRETDKHKGYSGSWSCVGTSAAADMYAGSAGGAWLNTAAITQIDLLAQGGGALSAGSRAQLYGAV